MASATTVPVRGHEAEAWVELDADPSLLEPAAATWRAAVVAELARPRVMFCLLYTSER